MGRFRAYKNKRERTKSTNNIFKQVFIVLFLVFISSIILFNIYGGNVSPKTNDLVSEQIDELVYQFFNELITNDVINKESINDILEITKNDKGEILTVNYDLEKTYTVLTNVSKILKDGLDDLQSGKINVSFYDRYIESGSHGLVIKVPLFLGSNNIFLNNLGPKIPVLINFSETLLTNIRTKVTNYGFNNALLEVYITVEMQKIIITPLQKESPKFNYDILIGALVVNGSVPEFYGGIYETASGILDIP